MRALKRRRRLSNPLVPVGTAPAEGATGLDRQRAPCRRSVNRQDL